MDRDDFEFEPTRLPFSWDDDPEEQCSFLWVGTEPFGMVMRQASSRWAVINRSGYPIGSTRDDERAKWMLEFNVAAGLWGAAVNRPQEDTP